MIQSIVLVALLGLDAAPGAQAGQAPAWQDDYGAARQAGRREKKPLAVFIGSGAEGWEKVSEEGKLTPGVQGLLARDYVCVYVDAGSDYGKRVAEAFGMTRGLVLSSRDGESQAFRHGGRLSASDLEAALRRHATESVAARTGAGQPRVSYSYDPAATRPAPAAYPAHFGGFGGYGGFGGFSGGGFGGGGSC
jgi:hypothetical protein